MRTRLSPRRRCARGASILTAACALIFASADSSGAAPGRDLPCVVELLPAGVIAPPDAWRLRAPESIALDHRGNVVIADTGNHRVIIMTRDGEPVTEFGGYGWDDGQFDLPSDLSLYEGFFTYVLDEGNRRVERFDIDGDYVDRIIEADEAGSPVAIAVGRSGELHIIDADSQTVLTRSQFDEELAAVGQFGTGEGGFARPTAVAVGPSGEIGVADPGRSAVLVFDEFGSPLFELSLPDTLTPADLVFDRGGACLVADHTRGRVIAFPPGGGAPTASIDFVDGSRPSALALDRDGSLLALDSERGEVLVIEMVHGECGARR